MSARMFELHRDADVSGVSGTGVVAEGIEFSSGVVALTWLSAWPTSVVFHDRGMESVNAIHGHDGKTRVVFTGPCVHPTLRDDGRCLQCGLPAGPALTDSERAALEVSE